MSNIAQEGSTLCYDNHPFASYSIQTDADESNENSPILSVDMESDRKRSCDNFFLIILLLILLAGSTVGIYLLAREGHEWRASEAYYLTTRELWQAHVPSSMMPELKLPVTGVLFLQANSSNCDSKSQCAKLVHELQLKHMKQWKEPDILYNFVISRDGSVFEGRGWKFQTTFFEYSSGTSVTVAFLGEFNVNPPTPRQAESAQLLIDVAVMERKLNPCYQIKVWGEKSYLFETAQAIQRKRSNCQGVT